MNNSSRALYWWKYSGKTDETASTWNRILYLHLTQKNERKALDEMKYNRKTSVCARTTFHNDPTCKEMRQHASSYQKNFKRVWQFFVRRILGRNFFFGHEEKIKNEKALHDLTKNTFQTTMPSCCAGFQPAQIARRVFRAPYCGPTYLFPATHN